jgi:uncharacterized membrane protein (DUF485 family)
MAFNVPSHPALSPSPAYSRVFSKRNKLVTILTTIQLNISKILVIGFRHSFEGRPPFKAALCKV